MSSQPDEIEDEWLRYRAEQIAYQERLEWEAQALVPANGLRPDPVPWRAGIRMRAG
jgi:hypothetical protein